MHEGDGDEEMMRVVSNGTRFRVPSHARSFTPLPAQPRSPTFLPFIPYCHHTQSMDFSFVGSTPLVVTRRSLFSVLFPLSQLQLLLTVS